MKLSEFDNNESYRQIIDRLEPRHAPKTNIIFTPPIKKSRMKSLMQWTSRVAAALVLVVGVLSIFMTQSQSTIGAVKIIETGLDNLRSSGYCNIEFSARILTSKKNVELKLSPRGDMHPVSMTFRTDGLNKELNLRWTDGESNHVLSMFPSQEVVFDGRFISDISIPSEAFSLVSDILFSPEPDYNKILNSENLEMKTDGDVISIVNKGKNKKVEFCVKFSSSSGRLLDFAAYDTSYGDKRLMIKTESITYKKPIETK